MRIQSDVSVTASDFDHGLRQLAHASEQQLTSTPQHSRTFSDYHVAPTPSPDLISSKSSQSNLAVIPESDVSDISEGLHDDIATGR